jgi:cyclic beta-1,2-glucan synthetase
LKDRAKRQPEHLANSKFGGIGLRSKYGDAPPLRSELYSTEQMRQHGEALAASHKLVSGRGPDRLLVRLAENREVLLEVRSLLTKAVQAKRRITPAGEWLLDNFYLIEEQMLTAAKHLPKAYSRALPRLGSGPSEGLPRVYDLAAETISHGDGRVDSETLSSFVAAYQTRTALELGELWALPIMLRLALIENLRRVGTRIAADRMGRNIADHWADRIEETAETDPNSVILVIADMARSSPPMIGSFVAELARRLQGQGPILALPLTWIEQSLSSMGSTIKELVQAENQSQAADQVSVSNSIGSLRQLGATDWSEFVESLSAVEQMLRTDPADVYARMDFSTRDHYRHIVERIARGGAQTEPEVAGTAIALAHKGKTKNPMDKRAGHVGYYLAGDGLPQLKHAVGYRFVASDIMWIAQGRLPLAAYLFPIVILTLGVGGALTAMARNSGVTGWMLALVGVLAVAGASQLAVSLVNWLATLLVHPRPLPRMDYKKGIPPEFRTLVVVPTMLVSPQNAEDLVEAMEIRFLANRDENLHFGLLTDFRDAAEMTVAGDDLLLQRITSRVEELNAKYRSKQGDVFYLFHRSRQWNSRERIWMGRERKRGKLAELNTLLRGGDGEGFALIVGDTKILGNVKYVLSLDTDTQLPRDAARQLVAAMAHPLNRPVYDPIKRRVSEGYGVLQPGVGASLSGANLSRYTHVFGSEPGIDPYTRVVSDVYQDLFDEGSFIGKGIYDIDAFDWALRDRLPDNRILSHDLIEGCYARSGLISDVQLYEEFPSRYSADVSRRYRWIRGDWQLLRWLLPRVPGFDGRSEKSPLSALSRWKLFDNLRRSLVPAAFTLLLVLGWTVLDSPGYWTLSLAGIFIAPYLLSGLVEFPRKPADVGWNQHLATSARGTARHVWQATFTMACLPHEALYSMDAIARTLWRVLVTRRHLLEWVPSGDVRGRSPSDFAGTCRSMWVGPVLSLALVGYLGFQKPGSLIWALPFGVFWLLSPLIAWWMSQPLGTPVSPLNADQIVFLRRLARKTWRYFESFVTPADNWLPPDNFQEHPAARVGHRTSPTNVGLALLANLSAYDFGYISAGRLIERTSDTFRTMEKMQRYRGHFYNWYDTQTMEPLLPMYVSTVDSGNLAGHLLTLRQGLLAIAGEKIAAERAFEGLQDTYRCVLEVASANDRTRLVPIGQELEFACLTPPASVAQVRHRLRHLVRLMAEFADTASPARDSDLKWWTDAFATHCQDFLNELDLLAPDALDTVPTLRELQGQGTAQSEHREASSRIAIVEGLARQCEQFADVDYDFLYDHTRRLLSIGYHPGEHRRDPSYYDLLASEARLCSFVAIAQGKLPQESWFALGRLLTSSGGDPILMSWSGSMFEYLMPLIVMPVYANSLLQQTCEAAVARQVAYGGKRGVPWGISESGYNAIDGQLNYQYRAFGVPGMGFKRGLAEDLVVSPYASALALMVSPELACVNLQQLSAKGFEGRYGLYEAIDYTPSRVPRGQLHAVVQSFMVHHQGMSLLSFSSLLLDRPMQRRFESDIAFQATALLLQERIPKTVAYFAQPSDVSDVAGSSTSIEVPTRRFHRPDTTTPELQLLSNGRYHVMITNAGGGYSRWKGLAVTRWREDSTCDNWGWFCYVRAVKSGKFWSTAHQPTLQRAEQYEATFSESRVEFRRRDEEFDTYTEIAVSPEDDIEIRRVSVSNFASKSATIDVTSYAEVVLASPMADAMHPAFSNLFVQTEILHDKRAILCTRRPRSPDEQTSWMFHLMAAHGATVDETSYETDRMKFIGRGRSAANPVAMTGHAPLSGSDGSILDPIVSVRHRMALEPEATVTIDIVTGIADTREACVGLVEKYQDRHLADRVFDLAWIHSQVFLRQINASESDAQLYARLAGSVIYADSLLRADTNELARNRRGQSDLWGYSVSGDLPIVLLEIGESENIELARQLIQAHGYWRLKGLAVDLVIWNEDHSGYRQTLQDQIMGLISAGVEATLENQPGKIYVRSSDQISSEDRSLFHSVARVVLTDTRGTLAEQLSKRRKKDPQIPLLAPVRAKLQEPAQAEAAPRRDLLHFNGLGGFTPDGREYIVTTTGQQKTPLPWVNVLANPTFGTVVSENGSACTWSENAHEFRLSPWSNDPVTDSSGEAFYLRDEESGRFWSPLPVPCPGQTPYATRHGFGYSVFEHSEGGIYSEIWVYVGIDVPVKFIVLKIRNVSGRPRRLSATGYVEWVLGDLRSKSAMHIVTEYLSKEGILLARNPYSMEFAEQLAFFSVGDENRSVGGDRAEFLGRNGTLSNPAAMSRTHLSGKVGAGLDPCAAIQVPFELADGQEREIVFTLGVGGSEEEVKRLVERFRGSQAAAGALDAVWHYWKHTLGAVQVDTPDASVNVMANGWLLYQTLACRFWGRGAHYQSGGAFGFRDQLQDAMALIHAEPQLLRAHLLRCASRQFREGDVQHWWHPPSGRGVRTNCSDDYLWLPLATCRYVEGTGDTGVLDETRYFLEGRKVSADEEGYYDLPGRSTEQATLYEHCKLAILRGFRFGEHGLPLIGSGDWNDGMNLVGEQGRGESVWLGFFLCDVLSSFAALAEHRGDIEFAIRCEEEKARLRTNLERHAWDGNWYLRAYDDEGSPLGSANNMECQIDSIAQSWAVLSGAGDETRASNAMQAVNQRLVRRDRRLIQLLDPPFDKTERSPGYIMGYVPGVRENGGQYTHAAIWTTMAFARLGNTDLAWELFDLINPVNHTRNAEGVAIYKAEPYVIAADVYSVPPHIGRGGWTWYTGSAGWMYRLIVESLLGLRLEVDRLRLAPCLPAAWDGFTVHYRYGETVFHIAVTRETGEGGTPSVTVDGVRQDGNVIALVDDRQEHGVELRVVDPQNPIGR